MDKQPLQGGFISRNLYLYEDDFAPRKYRFPVPKNLMLPMVKDYALGFMISRELLEDDMYETYPKHLQTLDAGDKAFMKEMGWSEARYRVWLRREVDGYEQGTVADLTRPVTGKHFEQVIVDDLTETPQRKYDGPLGLDATRPPFRIDGTETGRVRSIGVSRLGGSAPSPLPGPPATQIQGRRNMIQLARQRLADAFDSATNARKDVESSSPLQANYHMLLMALHEANLTYLNAVEDYLGEASINIGLYDGAQNAVSSNGPR